MDRASGRVAALERGAYIKKMTMLALQVVLMILLVVVLVMKIFN